MKNIFKIITISKPLHHLVWILAILILLSSLLALVAPILSKSIVDQIVAQVQHKNGNVNSLIFLIVLAFVMNLISLILTKFSDRIGDHFAGRLRKFLTERFYEKVLTLPQSYFDSEVSGKIMNQLNRGILTIQGFLNTATNFILPTFLQSIFIVIVLSYYNLPVGLFTFILFPIYLVLSYYSTVAWGREEVKKNKIEDITRGRISEVILNMMLVKSFNNEKKEYKTASDNLTDINNIYTQQSQTSHIFDF